jgi:hypothetical protein
MMSAPSAEMAVLPMNALLGYSEAPGDVLPRSPSSSGDGYLLLLELLGQATQAGNGTKHGVDVGGLAIRSLDVFDRIHLRQLMLTKSPASTPADDCEYRERWVSVSRN